MIFIENVFCTPYLFSLAPRGTKPKSEVLRGVLNRGGQLAKLQEKYKTIFPLLTKTKIE